MKYFGRIKEWWTKRIIKSLDYLFNSIKRYTQKQVRNLKRSIRRNVRKLAAILIGWAGLVIAQPYIVEITQPYISEKDWKLLEVVINIFSIIA